MPQQGCESRKNMAAAMMLMKLVMPALSLQWLIVSHSLVLYQRQDRKFRCNGPQNVLPSPPGHVQEVHHSHAY